MTRRFRRPTGDPDPPPLTRPLAGGTDDDGWMAYHDANDDENSPGGCARSLIWLYLVAAGVIAYLVVMFRWR